MTAFEVALPGGRALFSTRLGGVSDGPYSSLNLGFLTDDDPDRVARNQQRLAARCGLEDVAKGVQVHGTEIREWSARPAGDPEQVDGHATALRRLGLLVLAADCLPVALVAPGRCAMLHCGWRGLADGIIASALESFAEAPAAAVGPGIGGCCYEVGAEVLDAFAGLDGVARGRMLDLRAVAHRQLAAGGVTHVEDVDLCTSCRGDLFFSHRRDRGVTGRQGGLAWLT